MKSRTFYSSWSPFLIALTVASTVLAKDPQLRIGAWPLEWGSTCDEGRNKVIAGSCLFVTINNEADQPIQVLKPGWPEGYTLEAASDPADRQEFEPTKGLVARFAPTRYLSVANSYYERRVIDPTQGGPDKELLNGKHFLLIVPADLVGHTFTLRARYVRDDLSLVSDPIGPPIAVVAACTREDTARIVAGKIYAAYWSSDNERAIQIADSMLEAGLSDAAAWKYAGAAARAIERYDRAIVYLDRLWEDFGGTLVQAGTAHPPRLNRGAAREPELDAAYQRSREKLLQKRMEHEQQQR